MIYTGYFAIIRKLPENVIPISIARWQPKWLKDNPIPVISNLAPSAELLNQYHNLNNEEVYTKKYLSEINKYSENDILQMINTAANTDHIETDPKQHVMLCCYEKASDFCHRHLLAKYLNEHGLNIEEIDIEKIKAQELLKSEIKEEIEYE